MDYDSAAIYLSTRDEESLAKSKGCGLSKDLFAPRGKVAWDFVNSYLEEHKTIPPEKLIQENSGLKVAPVEDGVTITYVLDKMFGRAKFRALRQGIDSSLEALEKGNQEACTEEVHKLSDGLRGMALDKVRAHSLADVAPEVLEMYERTKRGEHGMPFPWKTLTECTMGMWPGTLTGFVARPGVGKTHILINIMDFAYYKCGKKVLIVSPEMSRIELVERQVAIRGKLDYGNLVSGTLGSMVEPHLRKTVEEIQETGDGYYILDDEERLESSYIEEAVDAVKPDLIGIDSMYMLRVAEGKIKSGPGSKGGRYDRILATVDWMRSFVRRIQIPCVAVSQLSRDGGKIRRGAKKAIKQGEGSGGLEDALAMTDTLFWDFHNLFALYQDAEMKEDKKMLIVPLKARRQAKLSSVAINWDMSEMNFDEIGTKIDSAGSYNDSEFDDLVL